jgi:hypothetical protein
VGGQPQFTRPDLNNPSDAALGGRAVGGRAVEGVERAIYTSPRVILRVSDLGRPRVS